MVTRIEPRTVEFGIDLTYPLFIDGVHVADVEVYAEIDCPIDEPRSWGVAGLCITNVDGRPRWLRGKALQDAEQVLIKHHDAYITECAYREAREAA
jgi:hypothetical protein